MDATSERFAANLRWLRGEPGLSQEELAFGAGMHRTQMSPLELGGSVPRFDWVSRLAGALGVTLNDPVVGIGRAQIVAATGGLVVTHRDEGDGDEEG